MLTINGRNIRRVYYDVIIAPRPTRPRLLLGIRRPSAPSRLTTTLQEISPLTAR
jgi:hypothetical protein